MVGLFGIGGGGGGSAPAPVQSTATPTTPTPAAPTPAAPDPNSPTVIGPFPDDGAKRMPVANSPTAVSAARRKRREITARSGRTSTRRVSDAGVRTYVNSALGDFS